MRTARRVTAGRWGRGPGLPGLPALLALLALLGPGATRAARAGPGGVELAGPTRVEGVRLADLDGDGHLDVLLLEGRRVWVWRGRPGALPGAAADLVFDLPAWATFVDAAPPRGGQGPATLLVYGAEGLARLAVPGGLDPLPGAEPLGWRDAERASFATLTAGGGLLQPTAAGWRYEPAAGTPIDLALPPYRSLVAPGPFLEDRLTVVSARPEAWLGVSARAPTEGETPAPALWALDGAALRCAEATRVTRYDLSFLPPDGDSRLVDLDGDGRPELLHRIATNRSGRYGFFRARPAAGEEGPALRPAVCDLALSGFQLDPELVDLDGDGRRDFVVTSIAVDMPNTVRALSSGKVGARTRAFLHRGAAPGGWFGGDPDAEVASDIRVKVRFNYAGTVEVDRHFTIVVDGDYDGDGRCDLLVRVDDRAFARYRGVPEGVWSPTAERVEFPPMQDAVDLEARALDLDGDGRDEVLLIYRAGPGGRDRARLWAPGR